MFLPRCFSIFAAIGIANDIMVMGRWQPIKFALSVLVIGVCAMGYAAAGIILRNQFWKALLPPMALQFVAMGFLARWFPDLRRHDQMNAAETERLRGKIGV